MLWKYLESSQQKLCTFNTGEGKLDYFPGGPFLAYLFFKFRNGMLFGNVFEKHRNIPSHLKAESNKIPHSSFAIEDNTSWR